MLEGLELQVLLMLVCKLLEVVHQFLQYENTDNLPSFSIRFLRDLKDFFGVTMKIRPVEESTKTTSTSISNGEEMSFQSDAYIISCVGIGYSNIAKKT